MNAIDRDDLPVLTHKARHALLPASIYFIKAIPQGPGVCADFQSKDKAGKDRHLYWIQPIDEITGAMCRRLVFHNPFRP
jgi:hypothetical protein